MQGETVSECAIVILKKKEKKKRSLFVKGHVFLFVGSSETFKWS